MRLQKERRTTGTMDERDQSSVAEVSAVTKDGDNEDNREAAGWAKNF